MYLYEVKYLSKNNNEWRTYKTMLYEKPESALKEAENFERYLDWYIDASLVTKQLVSED